MKKKLILDLKWRLIIVVVVCWVLPLLLFVGSTIYLVGQNTMEQITQTIVHNFDNAVRASRSNLREVFNSSRAISAEDSFKYAYANYMLDGNKVALYDKTHAVLNDLYRYDKNFTHTFLFFLDDPEMVYTVTNGLYSRSSMNMKEYRKIACDNALEQSAEMGTGITFFVHEDTLGVMRNVMNSNFEPYAMIVQQINKDYVFEGMLILPWQTGITVWIDQQQVNLTENVATMPYGAVATDQTQIVDDTVFKAKRLEAHSIIYINSYDGSMFSIQMGSLGNIVIFIVILSAFLTGVFLFFSHKNITGPVNILMQASGKIREGDLGYQIEEEFNSQDFLYLKDSYNMMSAQLKTMFEKSYQEQLALQDARVDALQSQINPHFLNNTLEIINWEARMAGADTVSDMMTALSTMLSGAMARGGDPQIAVSEELVYVDAYLYIVSARMGKRLTITSQIEEQILSMKVPRLILQPLVENAIEHGIEPRKSGELTLRAYRSENDLFLEVENDGVLSYDVKRRIKLLLHGGESSAKKAGRLGIRNVRQRIQLIYGDKSDLTIEEIAGGKTLARIRISTCSAFDE